METALILASQNCRCTDRISVFAPLLLLILNCLHMELLDPRVIAGYSQDTHQSVSCTASHTQPAGADRKPPPPGADVPPVSCVQVTVYQPQVCRPSSGRQSPAALQPAGRAGKPGEQEVNLVHKFHKLTGNLTLACSKDFLYKNDSNEYKMKNGKSICSSLLWA